MTNATNRFGFLLLGPSGLGVVGSAVVGLGVVGSGVVGFCVVGSAVVGLGVVGLAVVVWTSFSTVSEPFRDPKSGSTVSCWWFAMISSNSFSFSSILSTCLVTLVNE